MDERLQSIERKLEGLGDVRDRLARIEEREKQRDEALEKLTKAADGLTETVNKGRGAVKIVAFTGGIVAFFATQGDWIADHFRAWMSR